jgi:hypothetical protein
MPLFEAYKLIGQWQFGDEWKDGQELAAPSDEEIAENRKAEVERQERVERKRKAARAIGYGSSLHRIPKATPTQPAARSQGPAFPTEITRDDNLRKAARKRADQVWDKLRQWLYDSTVPAFCLDDLGRHHEVTNNTWARPDAITILHTGQVSINGAYSDVLISQAHLETAIRGEPRTDQFTAQEESTLDDGATEPPPMPEAETSEKAVSPGSDKSNSKPSKPGRPSQRAAIIDAYKELHAAGEIDFKSKKANYPAIREKITGSPHTKASGLGEEAIRTAIALHFKADKAKAKGAP